jgi:hypothetical protein
MIRLSPAVLAWASASKRGALKPLCTADRFLMAGSRWDTTAAVLVAAVGARGTLQGCGRWGCSGTSPNSAGNASCRSAMRLVLVLPPASTSSLRASGCFKPASARAVSNGEMHARRWDLPSFPGQQHNCIDHCVYLVLAARLPWSTLLPAALLRPPCAACSLPELRPPSCCARRYPAASPGPRPGLCRCSSRRRPPRKDRSTPCQEQRHVRKVPEPCMCGCVLYNTQQLSTPRACAIATHQHGDSPSSKAAPCTCFHQLTRQPHLFSPKNETIRFLRQQGWNTISATPWTAPRLTPFSNFSISWRSWCEAYTTCYDHAPMRVGVLVIHRTQSAQLTLLSQQPLQSHGSRCNTRTQHVSTRTAIVSPLCTACRPCQPCRRTAIQCPVQWPA